MIIIIIIIIVIIVIIIIIIIIIIMELIAHEIQKTVLGKSESLIRKILTGLLT